LTARPLVSTIIPTHNRAALLPRALDSVYAQVGIGELFDQEVIVVDDASTDGTFDVVQRYPYVRYVRLAAPRRESPRGASAAQNAGITASRGTLLAFLHDDDVWLPHRLSVQVPMLESHPEAGAVYSQEVDPSSGRAGPDVARGASGWIFRALLERGNFVPVSTLVVRRHAFEQAGQFDESLTTSEDWDMWLRLSFSFPILFLPCVVAAHSESPGGLMLTRAANGSAAADAARVIKRALRLLPKSAVSAEVKRRAWVHTDWPRRHVVHVACRRALAAESPLLACREFCAQLTGSPQMGARERWMVRQTVAEIWVEIARALTFDTATGKQPPIYEAACAVARAPSFRGVKALLRVIARRVLGRRAHAWCMRLYRKLSTMRHVGRLRRSS